MIPMVANLQYRLPEAYPPCQGRFAMDVEAQDPLAELSAAGGKGEGYRETKDKAQASRIIPGLRKPKIQATQRVSNNTLPQKGRGGAGDGGNRIRRNRAYSPAAFERQLATRSAHRINVDLWRDKDRIVIS
ncbi:Uncharacterized protein HZ326_20229 [Fusarium oxysporum f. sp. albedinis]|nr:Uncharacterized protein HZ326_20229 [Fusarium oxysporum f. sp. albedinis]